MVAKRLLVLLFSMAALFGCDMTQPNLRKPSTTIGRGGRLVEAKRCALAVVILTRTRDDRLLSESIWQVADEQLLAPELRRALQANGLRVGRISGDLPHEVDALLRAESTDQPSVSNIVNPSGQSTLVDPTHAQARSSINLLLSQPDGKVTGKPYEDAKGYLRITPALEGTSAVSLRIVPEVHHGPVEKGYGMVPTGDVAAPREFKLTQGQKEETFRELLATLALEPGQWAVLGSRAECRGSLGDLIFCNAELNGDRELQTVVLIQARRGEGATSPGEAKAVDFPLALLPGAKPRESAPKPEP